MFEDLQDPNKPQAAGEPASGAEPSQPAGGLIPENPPQRSSPPQEPRFDSEDVLPRDSDEGLRGPAEPNPYPSTGGLIERLTGALRHVTRPLRDTGFLRDTGALNRTGTLRSEAGRGPIEESRSGVTGELRSIEPPSVEPPSVEPPIEPPSFRGTRILPDVPSDNEPIWIPPEPERFTSPGREMPPDLSGEIPASRLDQLDVEPEEPKIEHGPVTGSLIERLTGSLRQTTGSLRKITGPLRGTGGLRGTGSLRGRGPEGEGGPLELREELPGSEGETAQPRQRPPRVARPAPEAYVPELRQTLTSEEGQSAGGRPTGGLLNRITGTLRKVTGPLRSITGSLRGTGQLRDTGKLREEERTAAGLEAELPAEPSTLPGAEVIMPQPEIEDDFLAGRLGTGSLVESEEVPGAYSTGWEDILVPPPPDIDITSEMLAESQQPAEMGEPDLSPEEPALTGDEPISLLDSGAIAALGRAEEADQTDYLPDWMTEIRQEAVTEEPAEPLTPAPSGAASSGSAVEGKPGRKGITGRLRDFITSILGAEEKRRPEGDLPDDLVTGRLERSMTTTELEPPAEAHLAEPAAPAEDFPLPEDRFSFGEPAAPETEAESRFDFNTASEPEGTSEVGPESEPGTIPGFSFGQIYGEEPQTGPVSPLEAEMEPGEGPFGGAHGEIGDWGKTRSLEDFELDLGEEGPLASRFEMFRERPPEGKTQPADETPAVEEPFGAEAAGAGTPEDVPADLDTSVDAGAAENAGLFTDADAFPGAGSFIETSQFADTGEFIVPDVFGEADTTAGAGGFSEVNPFEVAGPSAGTESPAGEEYQLSPEEEALLWGRADNLQTRQINPDEEPTIEEIWTPQAEPRAPRTEHPRKDEAEDNGAAPDLSELTDLRNLSLEDRTIHPAPPTGGLYMPVSDDAYAAAYLAGADLPDQVEVPKEELLQKALKEAGEGEAEEEVVSFRDLRTIALEGYQETAAPRAPVIEAPEEASVEAEGEGAAAAGTEALTLEGETARSSVRDLIPAQGLGPWLKERTVFEKVLLAEATLVVLALLVAVPFFIYTIVLGVIHPVKVARADALITRPLPADVPTPTGLVLPGGWYFDLNKSTVVEGQWKPTRSEWLEGTELTRTIALPWNAQTEAVIQTFKAGDRVKLDLSNGKSLVYKISEVRRVPVTDKSIFDNNRPTMVVILYQENAQERWVVFCKP